MLLLIWNIIDIKIMFFFLLLNHYSIAASSQRIVHSSKVNTPQRHNSESVLYMNEESINTANSADDSFISNLQHRSSRKDNRLFPISTYIENSKNLKSTSPTSSLSSSEAK